MSFKPVPYPGRWYGPLAMLALIALDVVFVRALLNRPVDGFSFILALAVLASGLVILYLGYRTFCAFTLEYWVDRNGVTLVWGPTQQVVPMGQIQRVIAEPQAAALAGPAPWHWPCPDRRRMQTQALGLVNAYSTRPLSEQIVLVTNGESYGVSPADSRGFVQALQERYVMGANRVLETELKRPPIWTWPLWSDRAALFLMVAGLVGVLVLFGALCFRYPDLSSDLPVHFDVSGLPDRIAGKSELFTLPFIGLAVWLFNTAAGVWLYRHVQRGAAYLLWFGALAVEGIAGLALFNLMRW
ncbi:MAG: DUF1648 domain-containing protein [Nitrososphaerales archaeon]